MSTKHVHLSTAPPPSSPWTPSQACGLALLLLLAGGPLIGCSGLGPVVASPIGHVKSLGIPKARASVRPPGGVLYSNVKAPLTTGFRQTPASTTKTGEATTHSLGVPFFFYGAARVAWGDGGLEAAKKEGGITDFKYAEYTATNILSVYTKFTVHAYGD